MERLTRWNGEKYILPQGRTSGGESNWRRIAERLGAYEDTGLDPEEIGSLDVLKRQAAALGYKLVKKPDATCYCCSEYPRTQTCAKTHIPVRKTKSGWTYCKRRDKVTPEAIE